MEITSPVSEAVLLLPRPQAKTEKLLGHFPPCLVHSFHFDLMVVVDSSHLFVCSQDGAFIEFRYELRFGSYILGQWATFESQPASQQASIPIGFLS